jgi:hypothetical protein
MREQKPQLQGCSIVLIGDFNPKIFQPAWFAAESLLQKTEGKEANIELIHSDVVVFSTDWLRIEVTRERFSAGTAQEPFYEVLRDLVLGTFTLLRYTPVTKMGINRDFHFEVESEDKWHSAGHKLAPKEIWSGILQNPGMRSLVMEGERTDGLKGYSRVQIEPSTKIRPGLFFGLNNHIDVAPTGSNSSADEIAGYLRDQWTEAMEKSENIVYSLLERLI